MREHGPGGTTSGRAAHRAGDCSEPPEVMWDADASTAEVLPSVMWVLEQQFHGLLPKAQRAVRLELL